MPAGAPTFPRPAHGRRDLPHAEEGRCTDAGHSTAVGDEGGFAPNLKSRDAALDFIVPRSRRPGTSRARMCSGTRSGATEFFKDGRYVSKAKGKPSIPGPR